MNIKNSFKPTCTKGILTLFQADICHAYQIFARHGVPKKNIIVFMTDDIAQNDL